jgi:hypothetical protein
MPRSGLCRMWLELGGFPFETVSRVRHNLRRSNNREHEDHVRRFGNLHRAVSACVRADLCRRQLHGATIVTYRRRARKFGALLDQAGITPSSVTLDCADPLTRNVPRARKNTIRLDTIARRLVQHLIDIGVAQPAPLTEAEIARAALLADFETYLVKQRGLSPRTIPHTIGYARRFLDYRFGEAIIDPGSLRPADATANRLLRRRELGPACLRHRCLRRRRSARAR